MANIINFGTMAQDDTPIVTDLLQVTRYRSLTTTGTSTYSTRNQIITLRNTNVTDTEMQNAALYVKVYHCSLTATGSASSGEIIEVKDTISYPITRAVIRTSGSVNQTFNSVGRSFGWVACPQFNISDSARLNQYYYIRPDGPADSVLNPGFPAGSGTGLDFESLYVQPPNGITVNYSIFYDLYLMTLTL